MAFGPGTGSLTHCSDWKQGIDPLKVRSGVPGPMERRELPNQEASPICRRICSCPGEALDAQIQIWADLCGLGVTGVQGVPCPDHMHRFPPPCLFFPALTSHSPSSGLSFFQLRREHAPQTHGYVRAQGNPSSHRSDKAAGDKSRSYKATLSCPMVTQGYKDTCLRSCKITLEMHPRSYKDT